MIGMIGNIWLKNSRTYGMKCSLGSRECWKVSGVTGDRVLCISLLEAIDSGGLDHG